MRIKFIKEIRLLVRCDCYENEGEEYWKTEQEWEFDKGEELDVLDVAFGEPKKYKTGKKPAKLMHFADISLNEGNPNNPNYIHMVPSNCFDIMF